MMHFIRSLQVPGVVRLMLLQERPPVVGHTYKQAVQFIWPRVLPEGCMRSIIDVMSSHGATTLGLLW